MATLAVLGFTIGFVALVCRWLWRARRDEQLRKALAAGTAAGIGASATAPSDESGYGGGGDGGDGGGD